MGVLRSIAFCLLLTLLILPDAFGSGFTYEGLGVKARGMGGAFRALADDWSAAYYNPAGYNRIKDNYLAANVAFFHNRYSVEPNVTWNGYESGFYNGREIYNKHEIINVPQGAVMARLPIWGETVFGLSAMQLFDQNQSWELYHILPGFSWTNVGHKQFHNNLDVVAFQLTAAKGFMEERLSVGLGLALLRGDLIYTDLVLRDNPMAAPINARPYDKIPEWYNADGRGWGFGYRAGLLYKVNDKIDVGLVYTGKTSIDISGETDFQFYIPEDTTLARNYFDTTEERYFINGEVEYVNSDFETTIDLPASIAGGVAMRPTEKLTLALDAEFTFWSQFEGFDFAFSNYIGLPHSRLVHAQAMMTTDMKVPISWDDAASAMLGANYQMNDFFDIRGGFGIDQSPMKEETLIPQFIDLGTKYSYSIGVGFDVNFWHLDLATTYTHQPGLDVPTVSDVDGDGLMDNLAGYYKADNYQTVLGISYRF